jgi:hypothetical protein
VDLDLDLEDLRQGWPARVELTIRNTADQPLLLETATWQAPLRGDYAWRRDPLGLIHYDAGDDRYVHASVVSTRAAVPLWTGLLLPGGRAGTLLPVSCLTLGQRSVTLRVSGFLVPEQDLPTRIYTTPVSGPSKPTVTYEPWGDYERSTDVVARVAGLERVTYEVTGEVEVVEDPDAPASAAQDKVPGGRLVGRCRRIGGAWILLSPDGALHLVRGDDHLRCPPGSVEAELFEHLDEALPFLPAPIVFRGPTAEALRREGKLPLQGHPDRVQQNLESRDLWQLLAALPQSGVRLTWERHAAIQDGLVAR